MVKYSLRIILASGSPRRIKMLEDLGVSPLIVKPEVHEESRLELSPEQLVMCLALKKALAVEAQLLGEGVDFTQSLLISADTIVYADRVIGKPESEAEAFEILSSLSGRRHTVYSGVCLLGTEKRLRRVFYSTTDVFFKKYTEEDIQTYIATGEPMDKAGAYAIQGGFAPYIDHIEGPMDNVIGFPLGKIRQELDAFGLTLE
jgi:septum formation protein